MLGPCKYHLCRSHPTPDFSWTFGSCLLSLKPQSRKGQDILFSTTYVHVDTLIFSRYPYTLLFMEKAGKSFRKVPQKDRESNKKETIMKANKFSHVVVWGWLMGAGR